MLAYIIRKLEPLLDMIVDPLIAWLRKRSLTFLIVVISALSAIALDDVLSRYG